MVIQFKYFIR